MKTLILILTLATFNLSFGMQENIADCGQGSNFSELIKSDNPIMEVSADSSSEPAVISSEQ